MHSKLKQIICSLLSASLCLILFWIGGIDFDHRGPEVAVVVFLAIYIFGCVYTIGNWKK